MIIFFGGSKQMNNKSSKNWHQLSGRSFEVDDKKESKIENSNHHDKM